MKAGRCRALGEAKVVAHTYITCKNMWQKGPGKQPDLSVDWTKNETFKQKAHAFLGWLASRVEPRNLAQLGLAQFLAWARAQTKDGALKRAQHVGLSKFTLKINNKRRRLGPPGSFRMRAQWLSMKRTIGFSRDMSVCIRSERKSLSLSLSLPIF